MFRERIRSLMFLSAAAVLFASTSMPANPQEKGPAPRKLAIRAGRLIDGRGDAPIMNGLIVTEGDKIISVTPGAIPAAGVEVNRIHQGRKGCRAPLDLSR
jgi:hypothetical protein